MSLKARIKAQIAADGPMRISDYMTLCLFDPADGYYTTKEPFGVDGDFTTAPEVSQMFGELVALWIIHQCHSCPEALARGLVIAEIGPGRGTLFADIDRTLRRIAPDLVQFAQCWLIETSPRLVGMQRRTLANAALRIDHAATIDALDRGDGLLIVIGNEIMDALPIRQFVKTADGWRERVVGLGDDGELIFGAGAASIPDDALPDGAMDQPVGAIFETSNARRAMMASIMRKIGPRAGSLLLFDYGHLQPGFGDTLQAVSRHAFADPLAEPGNADLTSHVDFHELGQIAGSAGLRYGLREQGWFLQQMGLLERAGALGAGKDVATQEHIRTAVQRLAGDGPNDMGRLFKVLAGGPHIGCLWPESAPSEPKS
ncbi:class I SAM-dependent methyltransferase [Notoacmeibacter sp. MSK16QG-6]|uniref:class I SAM-dependent methyltransferase n=1 Tax=Notoacmeibacter sp. MSK16QG-6 TaxID=2957982 RepID=UPI0020A212DB|nr:SAM-dependent methyltransferase [Notoacmeibacter sp. MSK16QG-6]